jgi:ABC-type sugar transport system ATPase subunit
MFVDMLLKVKALSYSVDQKSVLKSVNIEAKEGEITAILGANGSGKSTLLRLIAGHLDPDSGEIYFDDKKVLGPSYNLVPGHSGIALVRQDNRLFPLHTVRQNLQKVLQFYNEDYQDEKIEELSALLGMNSNLDRVLKFLSGGEQQRVSIAAALASDPKLILLDEPFSHMDMHLKQELKQYLVRIVDNLGIALLFVTHDPADALSLGNQIMVLSDGEIVEKGNNNEIYYHPKNKITAALTGYCNWLPIDHFSGFKHLHKINNEFLLRPDQIKIHFQETGSLHQAVVTKVEFCGFYNFIHLFLQKENFEIVATQLSQHKFEPGNIVWVSF